MEHPRKRVEGARALALAFVRSAETITRIKNLTMPRYRRLTVVDLNERIAKVHALCREWQIDLEGETAHMPQDKYAPMDNRYWTATGDNGKDQPINVGIFPDFGAANIWSRRQNETQRQQEWGNGSAGPMTFTPRPLYGNGGSGTGAPDPARPIFPERQWESKPDADQ
jgi:hypothetical protein